MDEDTTAAPGTLETLHLGISVDGTNCLLLFIDDGGQAMSCVASVEDMNGFITSLMKTVAEMRRRIGAELNVAQPAARTGSAPEITVTSAAFHMQDECMMGALTGDDGKVVGLRLNPSIVNEMTRAMLLAAPAASRC